MKIGYPSINNSIGCTANRTFRLRNYSDERMIEIVQNNLACLQQILEFNVAHDLLFFRISSDIVPFASHPIGTFDWQTYFAKELKEIGAYIKKHNIRISMHPDQFVLINTPKESVLQNSIAELAWHCELLDLLGTDTRAKVQIHVGGRYGDKQQSLRVFIERYMKLPKDITRRLVIENDHISYSLADCMNVYQETGCPIILDTFHHEILNNGESMIDAFSLAASTWKKSDGVPMIDYSSQEPGAVRGKHATSIDTSHFKKVMQELKTKDVDVMLEIRDKEKSALKAVKVVSNLL